MKEKRNAVFLVLALCTATLGVSPPAQALTPLCSDGVDNDGDSRTDYPDDTGCTSPEDSDEFGAPECSDGVDNDGDGDVDYPADSDCTHEQDEEVHNDPSCLFNETGCNGMVLHKDGRWLTGAIGELPEACMDGRPILIKKQREGRDAIKTYGQSDSDGDFRVLIKDRWKGKFYAVGPKWSVPQSDVTCERKVSNIVRIR